MHNILELRRENLADGLDKNTKEARIGAIIHTRCRLGKEGKIAMEMAIQDSNKNLMNNNKLVLDVRDSGGDPLQAVSSAHELIEEQNVLAIIGMDTWQEVTLVAQIGNQAQVPVFSFPSSPITSTGSWPYLVRMARTELQQMKCIAAIVNSYGRCKVIVIYEDDGFVSSLGILAAITNAIQEVGSEVEYVSTVPRLSVLSNPESAIRKELEKMENKHSKVFILLRASSEFAYKIFTEAKRMSLMKNNSVWIAADSVTSMFDTVGSSILSAMEGVLGVKTYISEMNPFLEEFLIRFRKRFRKEYPDEQSFDPGLSALRAYDTVSTIGKVLVGVTGKPTSKTLLQDILISSFKGLTGEIQFKDGQISGSSIYQIVKVIRKGYMELNFWSPEFGFSDSGKNPFIDNVGTFKLHDGVVNRQRGLLDHSSGDRVMLNNLKPMNIGVPANTSFQKFVSVDGEELTGFCIDIFKEALTLLHSFPHYRFFPVIGTYDTLVKMVSTGELDAAVGDVTILANRSNIVDFTQSYAESGLTMIVMETSEESAWIFVKPFTKNMWLTTGGVFVYTMFVVWFLEHRSNQDFRGSWKSQLGTTLWFTFSTLFFAHKEKLHSNFTRLVILVWLFFVFILTSSYTSSLTSMLTVERLHSHTTDIDFLKKNNSKVGCDKDSFIVTYLQDVLGFLPKNIMHISGQNLYPDYLNNGTIAAAFLELPYEKVFLSEYCTGFKAVGPTYRFGGLGFAFPKNSSLTVKFTDAILMLLESGKITKLEKRWFKSKCSKPENSYKSLGLSNFWVLFVITGGTSTIAFLLYLIHFYKKYRLHQEENGGSSTSRDESIWDRTKRLAVFFDKRKIENPERSGQAQERDTEEWISLGTREDVSEHSTLGRPQVPPHAEIELPQTFVGPSDTQSRVMSLKSFPGWDRHGIHGYSILNRGQTQSPPRT